MNKQLTKQIFGVPSLETAGRIDDSDKVAAFEAAHYRCTARMRELEGQFEVKASEIRAAFVADRGDLWRGGGGMKATGITLFCVAIAIIVLSVFAGMQKDSARTERLQANITPLEFATITINEPKAKVTTDSFTDHDLGITFDLDPWMLTKGTGETAFHVQIENLVPTMFYKYRDIQKKNHCHGVLHIPRQERSGKLRPCNDRRVHAQKCGIGKLGEGSFGRSPRTCRCVLGASRQLKRDVSSAPRFAGVHGKRLTLRKKEMEMPIKRKRHLVIVALGLALAECKPHRASTLCARLGAPSKVEAVAALARFAFKASIGLCKARTC